MFEVAYIDLPVCIEYCANSVANTGERLEIMCLTGPSDSYTYQTDTTVTKKPDTKSNGLLGTRDSTAIPPRCINKENGMMYFNSSYRTYCPSYLDKP